MTGEHSMEDDTGSSGAPENDDTESRLYPLSPKTMTTLFYLGLFGWAAVMLVIALDWNWQDKLFPLFFATTALILITLYLILMHAGDRLQRFLPDTSETGSDEMEFDETGDAETRTGSLRERYEIIMIGWAITLPIALYVIGFLYTIPLYTVGFIWYFNRDLRTAILTAAIATVLVYGLFVEILGIRLPSGILFG